MRSFSKKLAFVLAAAMVVTAFAPAASAKAADEMAINKSSQILYVNEGINHKGGEVAAPGKGNVSVYDFNLKNKPADWKTAYSFAWSSSDENVVTVAKGGVATAVGVGKATVYCKVTEKATNEVTTLKTKVTVKANAYDVEISNADAWDGATVEVNDVVDLNRTMYDEDGNKTTKRGTLVTDYTKWVAEPATGVEINQKNGQFTFTDAAEAGEYKLYCYTYQSSKYTEKTAEADPVVVELVKDSTFAVTQNSATKLTITLSSALKSLPVADVTVNRMVGDYAYAQVVRAAVLAEDGKSATVELFGALVDGATYVVKVKGFEDVSFVASVGAPTSMVVIAAGKTPANVLTTGETATVQCLFYDANGVEVTSADYEKLVTYKLEKNATQGEFILNNNKLTIKKDTAFATVIASYRGKFENGKIVGALEAKETFYAVDAPAVYPVGVKTYDVDGNWYDAVTTTVQVSDNKNLWLKLDLSNGKDATFEAFAGKNNEARFNNNINERITITPVTPEVADIVDGKILPNKPGTAMFYVNYGTKVNGNWNDVPFAIVEVTVIEDAYFNSISIANTSFTVSASDIYLVDGVQVSSNDFFAANADKQIWEYANNIAKRVGFSQNSNNILGYDQRGNRIPVSADTVNTVTIKCLSDGYGNGYDAKDLAKWPYISTWFDGSQGYWADGKNYIGLTIDGAMIKNYLVSKELFDAADNGQYISLDFEVTCKNSKGADVKGYFTVTVQEPTAGADNEYIEVKASSSYVDISRYVTPYDWNNNTESGKTLSFEVFKKSNGVTIDTVAIAPYNKNTATVGAYQYKILKDGQDITDSLNVTGGKTSDWPYVAAPELVKDNKTTVRLTGESVDGRLYTALGVTSGAFVPNYYDKGTGLYTFALYQWFYDEAAKEMYAVQLHQSDANVVMNGTGEYTIDKNAQLKNTVTISGDYAVDSVAILKSFTFKNRDGKNVLKTDDGVNYYFDGSYNYFVDYTATANYVYVKEVVFYESLGDGCYAPYTVSVDTSLVRK